MEYKLKRANAGKLADFILNGVEDETDDTVIENIEKSFNEASNEMYAFVKRLLKGDDDCKEFDEFMDVYNKLEKTCLVMGMSAGARMAIGLELGDCR